MAERFHNIGGDFSTRIRIIVIWNQTPNVIFEIVFSRFQLFFSIMYGKDRILSTHFLRQQAKIICLISRKYILSLDIVVQLRMSSYVYFYKETAVRSEFCLSWHSIETGVERKTMYEKCRMFYGKNWFASPTGKRLTIFLLFSERLFSVFSSACILHLSVW